MAKRDITEVATRESRRKGALAAAAVKRERKLTVRQRLARIAEEQAEQIAGVYLDAMEAQVEVDGVGWVPAHQIRVKAATALMAEAFGRPPQQVTVDDLRRDLSRLTERELGALERLLAKAEASE